MADRFVAASLSPLFDQLVAHFPTWSKNTLRQRLQLGCIDVNGTLVRRHDQPLQVGDVVTIRGKGEAVHGRGSTLPILFADDDLVAIDKPPGLLAVASAAESERTAMAMLGQQLAKGRGLPLWPAHRIDRETSGVLLFAKNRAMRDVVQANWRASEKVYVAVVQGHPEPPEGVIEAPLWEDQNLRVRVGEHPEAKPARTRFRTLARTDRHSRLEVVLDTGRKHQIRAHLAWLGHPVVGDDRYGDKGRRLFLHAHRLVLPHPRHGQELVLQAPVPGEFADL